MVRLDQEAAKAYSEDELVSIYWNTKDYDKDDRNYVAKLLHDGKGYMTQEELRNVPDDQLDKMLEASAGHTNRDLFCKKVKALFSYSFLTGERKRRDAADEKQQLEIENKSLQEQIRNLQAKFQESQRPEQPVIISMARSADRKTKRQTMTLSEDIANRWKVFCGQFPDKSLPLDVALTRLMQDAYNGKVLFQMQVMAPEQLQE